jgi:hypothetical protein
MTEKGLVHAMHSNGPHPKSHKCEGDCHFRNSNWLIFKVDKITTLTSDIRTSSIVLKFSYVLLVLYLKGKANSESLDVDDSTCMSLMSDFGVKFIPPCSVRAIGLKLDNGYLKNEDL